MRTLGLDLGQSTDNAAAAVLDRHTPEVFQHQGRWIIRRGKYQQDYASEKEAHADPNNRVTMPCVALKLWPLGTDYGDIIKDVLDLPADFIVVDFGGVGRPVVDEMRRTATARKYAGKIRPVQLISSSARASRKQEARGAHYNVPKIDVVSSIILAQQRKELVLPAVPETDKLLSQLKTFQMKITKAANFTLSHISGAHDDLVIALGLACWYSQRAGSSKLAIFM